MVTGEAQILRFRTGKTAAARGDRMHGDGRLFIKTKEKEWGMMRLVRLSRASAVLHHAPHRGAPHAAATMHNTAGVRIGTACSGCEKHGDGELEMRT